MTQPEGISYRQKHSLAEGFAFLSGLTDGLKSIWQSKVFSNLLHTLQGPQKHHSDGGIMQARRTTSFKSK